MLRRLGLSLFFSVALVPSAFATFDLAYISSGYTDRTVFEADAKRAFDYLMTYAPFSEFASQTRLVTVWTTASLGCVRSATMDRLITCSTSAVTNELTKQGIKQDVTIVLVNTTWYGGSGGFYPVSYRGPSMGKVAVHEGGHKMGALRDEYVLYSGTPGTLGMKYQNCANGVWAYGGCQYSGWKRSTSCSIMKSLDCPWFNPVSQELLRTKLKQYVN